MSQPGNEDAIVEAALDLPQESRGVFLDKACGDDAALRQLVEALLKVHQRVFTLGEQPKAAPPVKTMVLSPQPTEKVGDRIGRYKLLQQIGEGGCGVVYMAEQEEPIRRRAALKVIKLGMDTKQVIARFEAERQALALMDHPNIARVLDAGATESGRPYFVMELVRGVRITDYCDQNNLTTAQRLDLFIQVCQAIQHAHQKAIIHRDIKPSNILVTVNAGVAVPKLIDFGIAKATAGRLTDQTLFTAFEQFIGTPAYMSPEQAVLTSLDVDTRSDIYSLGVLLYELLTGQTPFDGQELLAEGLDAMRRTIQEQEPRRPSQRLTTMDEMELTTMAKRRQTDPPKLVHLVRGDLDWIVMKCLEKDRGRRYETANGLARDVERHLRDDPIVARPPTGLYRFQKLVRRNKVAFAAAGAVAAALVLGIVVSSWQAVRAIRAEREQGRLLVVADTARAREAGLREKAETGEMFSKIQHAKLLYDSQKFDEAEKLLNEIPPRLVRPDSDHASVRRGLGGWHAMRDEWKEAAANDAVLWRVDTLDDWNTVTMDYQLYSPVMIAIGDTASYEDFRRSAMARFLQASNAASAGQICRASLLLPMEEKAMAPLDALYELLQHGQEDSELNLYRRCWDSTALALVDYRRGNYSKAIEWCQKWLTSPWNNDMCICYEHAILAMSYHQLGQEDKALAALTEGRNANDRLYLYWSGSWHGGIPQFMVNFSDAFYGRLLLLEASALIEGRRKAEVQGYVAAQYTLARMYADGLYVDKDSAEAVRWYRKAADQGHAPSQVALGMCYQLGTGVTTDMAEAVKWFRKAAEQKGPLALNNWPGPNEQQKGTSDSNARLGRWADAVSGFSKLAESEPTNSVIFHSLMPLLVQTGDLEGYRRYCLRSQSIFGATTDPILAGRIAKDCLIAPSSAVKLGTIASWVEMRLSLGSNDSFLAYTQGTVGLAEYRQGHFAEAAEWARKGIDNKTLPEASRYLEDYMVLAMALHQLHQEAEAGTAFSQGLEIEQGLPHLEGQDLGNWQDWIIAHALMKEASALIEDRSEATGIMK